MPLNDKVNFGSPSRDRTCDLRINSPSLYRLSYRGKNIILDGFKKICKWQVKPIKSIVACKQISN